MFFSWTEQNYLIFRRVLLIWSLFAGFTRIFIMIVWFLLEVASMGWRSDCKLWCFVIGRMIYHFSVWTALTPRPMSFMLVFVTVVMTVLVTFFVLFLQFPLWKVSFTFLLWFTGIRDVYKFWACCYNARLLCLALRLIICSVGKNLPMASPTIMTIGGHTSFSQACDRISVIH